MIQVITVKISIDPLEKGKNKKLIGKFKDELGGLIMSEFCAHTAKTYAYRLDNNDEVKKG